MPIGPKDQRVVLARSFDRHRLVAMAVLSARSSVAVAFVLATAPATHAERVRRRTDQRDHAVSSVRAGAPSYISSLAQTADGVLWVRTNVGLYRFDGLRFERFEPPPSQSFPSRAINLISPMPDSSL